jgi:hypothetical protein
MTDTPCVFFSSETTYWIEILKVAEADEIIDRGGVDLPPLLVSLKPQASRS